MSYMTFDNKHNSVVFDDSSDPYITFPFCELLFSFLDIDLSEYNQIYTLIGGDFSYKDFLYLQTTYPQSYTNFYAIDSPSETDDINKLRDIALNFLIFNPNFSALYEHPIFKYSYFKNAAPTYQDTFYDLNFFRLQRYCKSLLNFCFINNNPRIAPLSKQERYFLFSSLTPWEGDTLYIKKQLYPSDFNLRDAIGWDALLPFVENDTYKYLPNEDPDIVLDLLTDEDIKKVCNSNIQLLDAVYCDIPFDFLSFELRELFLKDYEVKRCANCGNFFIPSGKYSTDCCDRVPPGKKYSCKKIMAQNRRKAKISSDPITKEFSRAYKRNYARVTNDKMSQEDFRLWLDEASHKRDILSQKYQESKSDQIIYDFKKYLGNK